MVGYGNDVCLRGELWLHGWPNLGNAQVRWVLAARQCVDIQIDTKNILFKIAVENAYLCRKNMRYAHFPKMCEECDLCEICGNRIFA